MVTASAPGKIILFGEHAVVYNKLGIACSIGKRCYVKVFRDGKNGVFVKAKDLNLNKFLNRKKLAEFFEKISSLKKENRFDEIKKIYKKNRLAPIFFVVSLILKKYGFKGLVLEIKSDIPKNLGSSAAIFSAVALGVSKIIGKNLSKKEISDFAYQGDTIAHGGTPSGIDNNTVTYGGYLKYKTSKGIARLDINFKIPLLIVDSGEKAKTEETVSYIRKLREKKSKFVNSVLNSLDNISEKALKYLKHEKFESLGNLMFEYYSKLKELDISTPKLNEIIDIALKNKALGAKPTGGWGGGCCLVLAKNSKQIADLLKEFEKNGFQSFKAKIGVGGVKLIKSRK